MRLREHVLAVVFYLFVFEQIIRISLQVLEKNKIKKEEEGRVCCLELLKLVTNSLLLYLFLFFLNHITSDIPYFPELKNTFLYAFKNMLSLFAKLSRTYAPIVWYIHIIYVTPYFYKLKFSFSIKVKHYFYKTLVKKNHLFKIQLHVNHNNIIIVVLRCYWWVYIVTPAPSHDHQYYLKTFNL